MTISIEDFKLLIGWRKVGMNFAENDPQGIQARLLKAACEIFAAKGYHNATVAEICKRADANIAAVNYYFRSKKKLYVQAWRAAFKKSISAHPPDGGVAPGAPPEERLRGRILSLMRRVADPDSREFDMVQKELANPTGLLEEVMRDSLEPIRRDTYKVVRELFGSRAPKEDVWLCEMSIIAQCFHPLMRHRHRMMLSSKRPKGAPPLPRLDIERIAEHVVRFSLAGIREIQRRIESADATSRPEE